MDKNDEATDTAPVQDNEKDPMPAYDPAMDLMVTGGEAVEIIGDTLG